MRNIKLYKLLLVSVAALTTLSCDDTEDSDSVITRFAKYPVTTSTAPVVADEGEEGTYTFDFTLDGTKQVNPIVLEVEVAANSTAEEDVDFELSAHEFELDAFEGQDGFSLDITVLQDFEIEDGDETVYLTFKTLDPSGVEHSEILAVTIKDSGLLPEPAETAEFAMLWHFTDPNLADEDVCAFKASELDLDVTFQTAGTAPYDDDLMGYAASTTACIEQGSVDLADMVDGEVYDIWVFIYGAVDYGDLSGLTVSFAYDRENTSFSGAIDIEGVFDTRQASDGAIIGTIEKNGNVLTLKDPDGDVVSEGRVSTGLKMVHGVKKPS
jgi:hypothetical protein